MDKWRKDLGPTLNPAIKRSASDGETKNMRVDARGGISESAHSAKSHPKLGNRSLERDHDLSNRERGWLHGEGQLSESVCRTRHIRSQVPLQRAAVMMVSEETRSLVVVDHTLEVGCNSHQKHFFQGAAMAETAERPRWVEYQTLYKGMFTLDVPVPRTCVSTI